MSEIASQLLAAFDTLPVAEQHEIVALLLQRTGAMPVSPLSDDGMTMIVS